MNEQMHRAMMLEKRCFDMFNAMGWDTTYNMEINLSNTSRFRPDITLSHNGEVVGCVEVKISYNNNSRETLRFIERVHFMLAKFKPTVFIFTNGYIFDLYLEGEYYEQLTFVPSPEDIKLLLKSKKEGK